MGALLGLGGCGTSSVHRAGRPPFAGFPVAGFSPRPLFAPRWRAVMPAALRVRPQAPPSCGATAGGRRVFSFALSHSAMICAFTPCTVEQPHGGGTA